MDDLTILFCPTATEVESILSNLAVLPCLEVGHIESPFTTTFRKREPWVFTALGTPEHVVD